MSAPDVRIPPAVRRFLARSIKSVEQLEVILLLQRAPDRYWDAGAVADYLAMRPDHAAASLEALAGKSLLDIRLGQTIKYRFNPIADEQTRCIRSLAELWRDDRQGVIREVTAERHTLRDFSDAFRIGKDDDDHG